MKEVATNVTVVAMALTLLTFMMFAVITVAVEWFRGL